MDLKTVDELLSTTRAVRKRLDLDKPVPPEVIEECIDLAIQAPTCGNQQGWRWVIVTDPAKKKVIGDHYRTSWYDYAGAGGPEYPEGDPRRDQLPRVRSSAKYLADRFHEVPAMVIPCIEGRVDKPGLPNIAYRTMVGIVVLDRLPIALAAAVAGWCLGWS